MENNQKQRNAFISVWLWLSVIGSALMLLLSLLGLFEILNVVGSLPIDVLIHLIFPCFYMLMLLVGYIELLRWKRIGFNRILSITLVYILVNVLLSNSVKLELEVEGVEAQVNYFTRVVAPLFSMLILFLILQVRKNGESYWSAMKSAGTAQSPASAPASAPAQAPADPVSPSDKKRDEKKWSILPLLFIFLLVGVGFGMLLTRDKDKERVCSPEASSYEECCSEDLGELLEFPPVEDWEDDAVCVEDEVWEEPEVIAVPEQDSETYYSQGTLSVNGIKYQMVYIEGGPFEPYSQSEIILEDYHIGQYEVTQELWEAVMGTDVIEQRNMANPKWSLRGVGDDYPMYYVSYYEAQEFCNRLNELTGYEFCLPTESQWEYAARGEMYDYSDHDLDSIAWYKDNSNESTHEVGSKIPNDRGLYDMLGNVREWCDGWYGSDRVLRGGGWYNDAASNSLSARYGDKPEVRDNNYGFRLCL